MDDQAHQLLPILSPTDRMALAQALLADSSSDDSEDERRDGGRGNGASNIASHQCVVVMMDMARSQEGVQNEALVNAGAHGQLSQLRALLLEPGVNVNITDGLGETALYAAVCHGHVEAARLLLAAGADANIACSMSWMALHAIARSGNQAMVDLLLEEAWAANTEVENVDGWTPLRVASVYGSSNIVAALLHANANVNASAPDGQIALHAAVDFGHEDVIRNLVSHGAQVDAQDADGRTSLHIAAMARPFPPQVTLLLELRADTSLADVQGNTALHIAVLTGHEPTRAVGPLLQNGADPNVANASEFTPLLYAIDALKVPNDYGEAVLECILAHPGTNMNGVASLANGESTPLVFAILSGNSNTVRSLLSHGADVHLRVKQGDVRVGPIAHAVATGQTEIARICINAGADVKEKLAGGVTLAHFAALRGHSDVLEFLLERGADSKASDANGVTPLHFAAEHHDPACTRALLAAGADVKAQTQQRVTPLHKAAETANSATIHLLLEAGADMLVTNHNLDSPLEIMRKKLRISLESETQLMAEHQTILIMMYEKLASSDPQATEVGAGDYQAGWFERRLRDLATADIDESEPQGLDLAQLRDYCWSHVDDV